MQDSGMIFITTLAFSKIVKAFGEDDCSQLIAGTGYLASGVTLLCWLCNLAQDSLLFKFIHFIKQM